MRFELRNIDLLARSRPTPALRLSFALAFREGNVDESADRLRLVSLHPSAWLCAGGVRELVDVRVERFHTTPVVPRDGEVPIDLILETPFDLLERLEVGRTSEVAITIEPRATMALTGASQRGDSSPFFLHPNTLFGTEHRVPRDAWHRLLGDLRFRNILVVEMQHRIWGRRSKQTDQLDRG